MPSSRWLTQSRWVFRCCWLAIVAMHAFVAFAFYSIAKLHVYIRAKSNVLNAMDYLGPSLVDYFPAVIAISNFTAVIHVLAAGWVIFWSLRYRALLFSEPDFLQASASTSQTHSCALWRTPAWLTKLWIRWTPCCRRQKSQGSESSPTAPPPNKPKHFEILGLQAHDLELLVEIGLETFQAHKMSNLIARVWINRLMALVLVLNCWFAPFVHLAFRRQHRATVEIVRLVLDSMLDIVYSIIVPSAIFYPYYLEFDVEYQSFDFINYYKDTWYIDAVAENRQFFVTSWLDFLAKMLPGLSLFLRLYQIKRILMKQMQFGIKKIKPVDPSAKAATSSFASFKAQPTKKKRKIVTKYLYNALLLGWGLGILILHLHATTVGYFGKDPGCLLELRPWAATKYVCVVLEVSCTQRGFLGDKAGAEEIFASVDTRRVQGLIFSHCAELQISSQIQSISRLQMLKIHNCTISEWGLDAALTGSAHPEIQLLYISLTNMTEIPAGLQSTDFPSTLYDVELCDTNLSALPDDLYLKWPSVQYFLLELSPGITQIPPALRYMASCDWLSLCGNAISEIPDDFFQDFRLYQLILHNNPLQKMPENLGDLSGMRYVGITNTNVSQLPLSWRNLTTLESTISVTAAASPLCESWLQEQEGSSSEPDQGFEWGSSFIVGCEDVFATTHLYPLAWERLWRSKNR